MTSFVAIAILALACSASASVIRTVPFPVAYSAPLSYYYYHPSAHAIETPVLRTIHTDVPLETQRAWQKSILAPVAYSSRIAEAPKTFLSKQFHTPLVWRNAVEAPKTSLLKGVPAPVAYHSLPEVSYAYTPIVHQQVVVAQPEASYIASTRSATHIAPLPGHSESVISQNLEPAFKTA